MEDAGVTPQSSLLEFADLMRVLRDRCPWKQAQTHRTLARHLVEETYEVLEAIDVGEATGDWSHLREELGDVLLQVYFHAVVAEDRGDFTLEDVAADITAKMRRRNPHVLGTDAERESLSGDETTDPEAATRMWEAAKAAEKRRTSPLEGLPPGLPALLAADKVIDRLERAGTPLDLAGTGVPGAGVGERLLALVAEARAAGVDPEQELRDAVRRRL